MADPKKTGQQGEENTEGLERNDTSRQASHNDTTAGASDNRSEPTEETQPQRSASGTQQQQRSGQQTHPGSPSVGSSGTPSERGPERK